MSKTFTNELENLLVWSAHRTKTLGTCPRRYYFNYVGSWGGWDVSTDPDVQAAYRLKHLTSPDLEIGNVVHEQIRLIFEKAIAGRFIDPAIEIKIARGKFEMFVDYSAKRRLEDLSAKRRKLMAHETGQPFGPADLTACLHKIGELLEGFFAFDDVRALLANPACIIPELLDPPGFEIGTELGVPARPKTDAVFLIGEKIVVSDWKTGTPRDEHRDQGLVYDLFIRNKLSLPPTEPIEVRFYYLGTRQMVSHVSTEDERTERLWAIGEQFEEMKSLSDDPKINCGPESRFPAHVSRGCYGCNHRLMCEAFLASKLARSIPGAP